MKIDAREAAEFFRHPSQQFFGFGPDNMLDVPGLHYIADGPACAIWHLGPYPDAWFVHLGVKRDRGLSLVPSCRRIMSEFSELFRPQVVMAWVDDENKAIQALMMRLGFEQQDNLTPGIAAWKWRP